MPPESLDSSVSGRNSPKEALFSMPSNTSATRMESLYTLFKGVMK